MALVCRACWDGTVRIFTAAARCQSSPNPPRSCCWRDGGGEWVIWGEGGNGSPGTIDGSPRPESVAYEPCRTGLPPVPVAAAPGRDFIDQSGLCSNLISCPHEFQLSFKPVRPHYSPGLGDEICRAVDRDRLLVYFTRHRAMRDDTAAGAADFTEQLLQRLLLALGMLLAGRRRRGFLLECWRSCEVATSLRLLAPGG